MKKMTLLLLAASLLPSCVLAWNTPGEDFSGELKLEGQVSSTRNPWVWKVGDGNKSLDIKQISDPRDAKQRISVSLPALNIVMGKTTLTTPAGREGLSPRVTYGKGVDGFTLAWTEPGTAEVTLPVGGENNAHAGTFTFRMQAAAVLRHTQNGQPGYAGVYDDLGGNGLPEQGKMMQTTLMPGFLQVMFRGEGPSWLQTMVVSGTVSLSHFSDAALRQVEGVYGAQIIAGQGELRLDGNVPERWQVSLPVSIEYQ